jgi:uridine kinase
LKFWLRNKETDRDEFIFYSKRLMRILIEYALSLLPFEVIFIFKIVYQYSNDFI